MNKSYSEMRQAVLFKASRDLRAVAARVLDDMQNDVELTSPATLHWSKQLAYTIATQANELESQGHEMAVATQRANTELSKSRDAYSASIDAFEERKKRAASRRLHQMSRDENAGRVGTEVLDAELNG